MPNQNFVAKRRLSSHAGGSTWSLERLDALTAEIRCVIPFQRTWSLERLDALTDEIRYVYLFIQRTWSLERLDAPAAEIRCVNPFQLVLIKFKFCRA